MTRGLVTAVPRPGPGAALSPGHGFSRELAARRRERPCRARPAGSRCPSPARDGARLPPWVPLCPRPQPRAPTCGRPGTRRRRPRGGEAGGSSASHAGRPGHRRHGRHRLPRPPRQPEAGRSVAERGGTGGTGGRRQWQRGTARHRPPGSASAANHARRRKGGLGRRRRGTRPLPLRQPMGADTLRGGPAPRSPSTQ